MKTLYFDGVKGVSGDMILSALLDTGIPIAVLSNGLQNLDIASYELILHQKQIKGISTLNLEVRQTKEEQLRHYADIVKIIREGQVNNNVKTLSLNILQTLGTVEAEVHNVPIEKVHFHEIGAIDTIIDIVGTAILIDKIQPDYIGYSPINLGSGMVEFSHGRHQVPAPAVAKLAMGMKTFLGNEGIELATPTGMAILKTLCNANDYQGKLIAEGYGAGTYSENYGTFLRATIYTN